MTLHNGKKIVALRLLSLITTVLFVIYILLAYFAKVFYHTISSNTLDLITVIISVLYLTSVLWPVIFQYKYIFFSDDGNSIILRWYSVGLISGESKSIEIPKNVFAGYEINKKNFGFYKYIVLYQTFQNRRAGYPPVTITALGIQQIKKITDSLDSYK